MNPNGPRPRLSTCHVPRKTKPVASPQATTLPSTTQEGTSDRVSYSDNARRAPSLDTPMAHRGLRPNGSTTIPANFDLDLKSPIGQRQRRRQEHISGHYWHSCQYDIHEGKGHSCFEVAWLHHNIDGPYEGKPDKLQKLSLSLADDSTESFLRFTQQREPALELVVLIKNCYPHSPRPALDSMCETRLS
jgi:hypothetical protein